jgi:hypothetical protein
MFFRHKKLVATLALASQGLGGFGGFAAKAGAAEASDEAAETVVSSGVDRNEADSDSVPLPETGDESGLASRTVPHGAELVIPLVGGAALLAVIVAKAGVHFLCKASNSWQFVAPVGPEEELTDFITQYVKRDGYVQIPNDKILDILEKGRASLEQCPLVVEFDVTNDVMFIGDLHGDMRAFHDIVPVVLRWLKAGKRVIFMGDYFDAKDNYRHSTGSLTIFLTLLLLQRAFSNLVTPLRGNHEEDPQLTEIDCAGEWPIDEIPEVKFTVEDKDANPGLYLEFASVSEPDCSSGWTIDTWIRAAKCFVDFCAARNLDETVVNSSWFSKNQTACEELCVEIAKAANCEKPKKSRVAQICFKVALTRGTVPMGKLTDEELAQKLWATTNFLPSVVFPNVEGHRWWVSHGGPLFTAECGPREVLSAAENNEENRKKFNYKGVLHAVRWNRCQEKDGTYLSWIAYAPATGRDRLNKIGLEHGKAVVAHDHRSVQLGDFGYMVHAFGVTDIRVGILHKNGSFDYVSLSQLQNQ